MSQSSLPTNWEEKTDPKSGKVYYYNTKTRETSWNRPAATPNPQVVKPASPQPQGGLPVDWEEKKDPKSGKVYYYNTKTRETSWSRPAATPSPQTAKPASPQPATAGNLPADWEEKTDPKSGKVYYYNTKTRETSWNRPAATPNPQVVKPASPQPQGGLPVDWEEKKDPKSGKVYFYNTKTRETSWNRPAATPSPQSVTTPIEEKPQVQAQSEPTQQEVTSAQEEPREVSPNEENPTSSGQNEQKAEGAISPESIEEQPHRETPHDTTEEAAPSSAMDTQDPQLAALESLENEQPQSHLTSVKTPVEPILSPDLESTKVIHETLPVEDFAQRLIQCASMPNPYRNPMIGTGTETLLKLLGVEGQVHGAQVGPTKVHPSHTLMTLLRRLNEEFRSKLQSMRDTFEDAAKGQRRAHELQLEEVRYKQVADIKALHDRYPPIEPAYTQKLSAEALQLREQEMAELEKRMLDFGTSRSGGNISDAKTRRLLVFWKSKYNSLRRTYEQKQEEVVAIKQKYLDAQHLYAQNPQALNKMVTILREKEQHEKQRAEVLKARYVQEATKRGVPVVTPKLSATKITDSMLSHAKIVELANVKGNAAGSDVKEARAAKEDEDSDVEELPFFTPLGKRSKQMRVLIRALQDRKQEADYRSQEIEKLNDEITELAAEVEVSQTNYSSFVGTVTGPTVSLLEEIIALRAHIDEKENEEFSSAAEKLTERIEEEKRAAKLVEGVEVTKSAQRMKREELKRQLREKDVDMYRVDKKVARGQQLSMDDFSDAPTKDVQFHLEVLRSRLAVVDCERQLLRGQLDAVHGAAVETSDQLDKKLQL